MDLKQIEKKIEAFNLPVFPQMLVQVKKVSSDERSSAQDLSEIILKDQSLTSKILSVANSAYYGFYGKISTITQAIVALGFESVKNIAFGITVHNSLSAFIEGPYMKQFWEHSLATGVCAELLAEKIGYNPSEETMVGGLIHDVGKLLLAKLFPEQYKEVEQVLAEHEAYSHVVEASILGITHCLVGEMMAKKWGLPDSLVGSIRDHHKKEWGKSLLTDIVAFSDFITHALQSKKGSAEMDNLIKMGSSQLNLQPKSIMSVMLILTDRLDEYSKIFEIRIDSLLAYTTMVEQECTELQRSTISKRLSRKEEEMSILTEISNAMIKGRPQDEILQMVLEGIIRTGEAVVAVIFIMEQEKSLIKGKIGLGKNAMQLCSSFSLSLDDDASLLVRSIRLGERHFVKMPGDGRFPSSPDQEILSELEVASALIFPLSIQDKALGALMVAWKTVQTAREDKTIQTLSLFANQASLILGTPNEIEERASRTEPKRSALLLDID